MMWKIARKMNKSSSNSDNNSSSLTFVTFWTSEKSAQKEHSSITVSFLPTSSPFCFLTSVLPNFHIIPNMINISFLSEVGDLITHQWFRNLVSRGCHMAFSKLFFICIMPLDLFIKHQTARKIRDGLACLLSLIGFKLCSQELRKSEIKFKSYGHTHTHTHSNNKLARNERNFDECEITCSLETRVKP